MVRRKRYIFSFPRKKERKKQQHKYWLDVKGTHFPFLAPHDLKIKKKRKRNQDNDEDNSDGDGDINSNKVIRMIMSKILSFRHFQKVP